MRRRELLLSYVPMANYIAKMNGQNCEVVIHDVRDPDRSMIYITTPNMTGRPIGAGLTDYARHLVESKQYMTDDFEVNYIGVSQESGRTFRSSTYYIRDGKELAGLLCVNVDISNLVMAREALEQAMVIDPSALVHGGSETFVASVDDMIDGAIADFAHEKVRDKFPTAVKKKIALRLKDQGVFQVKGAVITFAARIGVSEQTVYRYLK